MTAADYTEFDAKIQEQFGRADYAAALATASAGLGRFPDQRPMLDYWRMCASARLHDNEGVCRILTQSLASGFWYGEAVLRQSPSFQPLQGLPDFERLVIVCRERQAAEAGTPVLRTLVPESSQQPALLLALHGNQSSARDTQPFWEPARRGGWLVALPQSSQLMWQEAHIWTEPEEAQREVVGHYETLLTQFSFDQRRLVLGGHSMGGEIAIWLALRGALAATSFIVIGPGGPLCDEPEAWAPLIAGNTSRDLRGYFVIGGRDRLIQPGPIRQLVRMLTESGLACALEEVPDATHDPHPGYAEALLRGLAFVHSGDGEPT